MAAQSRSGGHDESIEFMTGNPQLGLCAGTLQYFTSPDTSRQNSDTGEHSLSAASRAAPSPAAATSPAATALSPRNHAGELSAASSTQQSVDQSLGDLPEDRSCLLCITCVPAHMVPTDLLQFLAPVRQSLRYMRIVRPFSRSGASSGAGAGGGTHGGTEYDFGHRMEYMVMLEMANQELADTFYRQYNGQPFSSMLQDTRCHVVFVSAIGFDQDSTAAVTTTATCSAAPAAAGTSGNSGARCPSAATSPAVAGMGTITSSSANGGGGGSGRVRQRLDSSAAAAVKAARGGCSGRGGDDSCVICFERLDNGGVLTTACNHTFHIECIARWQDSPCPVCRFHHNGGGDDSACQECGGSAYLHVCLICGFVGCGGHADGSHMARHHLSTLHAYALDVETQQVWDFAGGGFVHRLIYNKADGKMVEAALPASHASSGERPQAPPHLSDAQEERLVHGKLEGLSRQYNTLLASQLDQQRAFYEKQIGRLLEEQEEERARRGRATGQEVAAALRQEQRQLQQKVINLEERLRKVHEDIGFQKELNASLEANAVQWEAQLCVAEDEVAAATAARNEWVPKLEAKVAELMQKLDGGSALAAPASNGSASTTMAPPVPSASVRSRKNSPDRGSKGRRGKG